MENEETTKALPDFIQEAKKKADEDKKKKAKKSESESESDDEKDDDSTKKSSVTEDELRKSLDKLESVVASSPTGRKKALMSKAMNDSITSEENDELMSLMAGQAQGGALSKGIDDLTAPSNQLQKSVLDVSPYLKDMHAVVTSSLQNVAEAFEKSDARHQEQIVVLAKGLLDIGKVAVENMRLVKSLTEQMGVAMRTPGARRSVPTTSAAELVEKSFGGQAAGGSREVQLNKAQVLDIIGQLNEHSQDGMSKSGENLAVAATKYEQFNQISTPLLAEVQNVAKHGLSTRMGQNGVAR